MEVEWELKMVAYQPINHTPLSQLAPALLPVSRSSEGCLLMVILVEPAISVAEAGSSPAVHQRNFALGSTSECLQ